MSSCELCGSTIRHKPSVTPRFCSMECYADARRTRPRPDPRPCVVCGTVFKPARHRGDAKYCSKRCVWDATRGPEFNAALARKYNPPRNRATRGTGTKGYVKVDGRHEHRIVAEKTGGRPLTYEDVVHHIDGDKHNNDIANLTVMTRAEHIFEHKPWNWRHK